MQVMQLNFELYAYGYERSKGNRIDEIWTDKAVHTRVATFMAFDGTFELNLLEQPEGEFDYILFSTIRDNGEELDAYNQVHDSNRLLRPAIGGYQYVWGIMKFHKSMNRDAVCARAIALALRAELIERDYS